ncbi:MULTISPECIES: phosphatidate cytidylyltransferase [Geobacillus]|jgi:phosphatidate cytidylyltransferase|uniref:Phosphatidate cytidylyltransferase n=4 Tax=Geobacillus thermodenitrificans TaxID=33940 RepID=A4IMC8_GEOTN|nr:MULTISPECIES: phosphatidate cytidylyltransferase [Geobacillus]ABO66482.1 Phosphatidate cytidylyltransferase [Geobacillus thermodenitrificans NG80-2]ARA97133.1 phosphatidate cytidylyltransferase [Geobacillus thermodenitrificans]ARP42241.1 Phosphatidate cytidylyltransferase [Geobacillus thermodenitrificans]ATO36418.1 phosphatidate cytidylyltransferase [Geobacillus thermodenitrificans]KQB93878.1 Phosphatidate cytidylyltransferase [Geobacillus sp. PA-3]
MKQRIITGVIAAALFLPIVILGGFPFIIVTYILATVGLFELLRMKGMSPLSFAGGAGFAALWLLLVPASYGDEWVASGSAKFGVLAALAFLLLVGTVLTKNTLTFDEAAFIVLAVLYVGVGFFCFGAVRLAGLSYLIYALFVIWATDIGAYFFGRAFGRRKLWPEISPNKTIEGAIGGIGSAVAIAAVYEWTAGLFDSLGAAIGLALLLSMFGQLGDLVESAFKRHYGVKDSGAILPGHGGILDRFDSLLFVLPLLYIFIEVVR